MRLNLFYISLLIVKSSVLGEFNLLMRNRKLNEKPSFNYRIKMNLELFVCFFWLIKSRAYFSTTMGLQKTGSLAHGMWETFLVLPMPSNELSFASLTHKQLWRHYKLYSILVFDWYDRYYMQFCSIVKLIYFNKSMNFETRRQS